MPVFPKILVVSFIVLTVSTVELQPDCARIKTNTTGAEFLYLPLEVEVSSQPGLYCPQVTLTTITSNREVTVTVTSNREVTLTTITSNREGRQEEPKQAGWEQKGKTDSWCNFIRKADLQKAGSTGSAEPNFFSDFPSNLSGFPPNYELSMFKL